MYLRQGIDGRLHCALGVHRLQKFVEIHHFLYDETISAELVAITIFATLNSVIGRKVDCLLSRALTALRNNRSRLGNDRCVLELFHKELGTRSKSLRKCFQVHAVAA